MTLAVYAAPLIPARALDLPRGVEPTLRTAPVQLLHAGRLALRLEVTPLSRVQQVFGGSVRRGGDAGEAVTWLCFAGMLAEQPVVFWFVSNDEAAGESHALTQVALQDNPGGESPEGCSETPVTLTGLDFGFGIPALGATRKAVITHFGGGPAAAEFAGYASSVPSLGREGGTTLQTLQYRFRDNRVTALSVAQVTSF